MKRSYLATALLLLLSSSWALTQSSSTSSQQPDKSQTSDQKGQKSIEGCLSGGADTFRLTAATGKIYELKGDASGLNANVGHKVRLWGTAGGADAGGEDLSASGPYYFDVKRVESLSDTCNPPNSK